jgi:hypothetical protein
MALIVLPATTSCFNYDDEDIIIDSQSGSHYINVTISVSASDSPVTRANPVGGEYGDGVEKGIDPRENEVNDITLIFFKDNAGINTTNTNTEVLFVKKYAVHEATSADYPSNYTHTHKETEPTSGYYSKEVIYTTGNQRLEETDLEVGQTYQILVVANADPLVVPGDKIVNVREKVNALAYSGTGAGINATNFVMTSETDASVTLSNPTPIEDENKYIYYFDCIHIERLAARIDYCTRGATYNETYGGYVYTKGNDIYVVTKVTPFNLYNESEYFFKRVQAAWPATSTTYLGDESLTNYVVDPLTAGKNDAAAAQALNYSNRLTDLLPVPGNDDTNPYTQVMADVHTSSSIIDDNNDNCIIIGYPRENTLKPDSPLKLFATGIVFEIDFYRNVNGPGGGGPGGGGPGGNPRPETRKYYHYLRHQGEPLVNTHSYKAERLERPKVEQDNSTCGDVPMKCGIVRNNIYRVSITGFSDEDGTITLTIEEEKWRHVDNPTIYI